MTGERGSWEGAVAPRAEPSRPDGSPLVSVIIPTRNRRDRLPLALHTALHQRDVDHEVVVVDDGSADDTPRYLATHPHPRLRVVRQEGRGLSAARNAGIEAAAGQWLAFLDDDDLWAPDKLVAQLRAVSVVPGAMWCATGSVTVDRDFRITGGKRTPPPANAARLLRTQNVVPGGGSGVMVHASLVAEVGAFDVRFSLAADWDLWIRLAERSAPVCVDRPLVGYVLHGANLSTAARGYEAELLALEEKYRDSGRPVSAHIPRAALAVRDGRRSEAVALLLHAARKHRAKQALIRAAVIAGGSHVERLARRFQPEMLPGWWHAEAGRWLDELRGARAGVLADDRAVL